MRRSLGARVVRRILRLPGAATVAERVVQGVAKPTTSVFMLHRFTDPEIGARGDAILALRDTLELFRRVGVRICSLSDLITQFETQQPPECPQAAFTVDDGYLDFATAAKPVFAAYDCPVTVFLTTEVVAGRRWYWWDRLEYAVLASPRRTLAVEIEGTRLRFELSSRAVRIEAAHVIVERLKVVPNPVRAGVMDALGATTDVEVPSAPPLEYRALSWEDVRHLERDGVSFGPHSRTHPILSRVDDATAHEEIAGSWQDMLVQCASPVPVFCYPNGTAPSFTARDAALVREAGMRGAVTYDEQRIVEDGHRRVDLFRIPRMALSPDPLGSVLGSVGLGRSG